MAKDFQCQECGRKMTADRAQKGCPSCGSDDIDVAPAKEERPVDAQFRFNERHAWTFLK